MEKINDKRSLNRSNNSIYYPFYEEFHVEDEEDFITQQYFEKERNEKYYKDGFRHFFHLENFYKKTKILSTHASRIAFLYLLTWKMLKKDLFSFFLGIFSCFFVVLVVAIGVTIISKIPIIYLNTAQNEVGEFDMIIKPSNNINYIGVPTLNFTMISALTQSMLGKEGHISPRWSTSVGLIQASGCMAGSDPAFTEWKYDGRLVPGCEPMCVYYACEQAPQLVTKLWVLDFEKEAEMQLGHSWPYKPPPKGTVYIQQNVASKLNLRVGDYAYFTISASHAFKGLWNQTLQPHDAELGDFIEVTLKIGEIFSDVHGKFPEDTKDVILMDYKTFWPHIVSQANPKFSNITIDYAMNQNFYDFSQMVVFNFKNRIEFYMESDLDQLLRYIQQISNRFLYRIGTDGLDISLPVYESLNDSKNTSMFLSLILNVLILILVILSTFLIYSLLMVDVDSKTYETGVLRMIGSSKKNLFYLMLFKAFNYCVFSIIFGLLTAQLITYGIIQWFEEVTGQKIDYSLTGKAIWLALSLGIIIPIVSMIFPVRRALGHSLHDSLESSRSKIKSIIITIERSSDSKFSFNTSIIGAFLSVFGFGAYYIFPLSLVSGNLGFLLNSMFVLLVVLVLGLVVIALNFQQLLNQLFMRVLFFWEKSAIKSIVLKNMIAHKMRNRKTSILYSVSLGLILLTQIIFVMQLSSSDFQRMNNFGTFIRIQNDKGFNRRVGAIVEQYIDSLYPEVLDFSWISQRQPQLSQSVAPRAVLMNLGQIYSNNVELRCISPNLYSNIKSELFQVDSIVEDPDITLTSDADISKQLYSTQSSNRIILGSKLKKSIVADLNHPSVMVYSYIDPKEMEKTSDESAYVIQKNKDIVYPMAFMDFGSPFKFSKFPSMVNQDALVSIPSFLAYTFGTVLSVRDIPFESMILRVSNEDKESVQKLTSKISHFIATQAGGYPTYAYEYYGNAKNGEEVEMVNLFFSIITALCMSISYFSLSSSMYININEQVKEIGILRSMGISKWWIIRIYIYESIVLILTSCMMGVCIGTFLGWAMVEQRKLITQLPLPLQFPWTLLMLVFVFSIILGTISSFSPIRKLLNNPVVKLLRS